MYYLSQACCVCFESREKLNSLNNEVNQLLLKKFQYCIGDVEPDVPLFICNACCPSLNSAYEFKKSCTMNIARLRSYVTQLVQQSSTETVLHGHGENDRIVYSDIQVHITRCSPTLNFSSKHLEPTFVEIQSIKTESEFDSVLNNSVKEEKELDLSEDLSGVVKEEHDIMPIESVLLVDYAIPCDEKSVVNVSSEDDEKSVVIDSSEDDEKSVFDSSEDDEKSILNNSSEDVTMVEASNIHHTPTSLCSQSTEELDARKSDKTCEVTKEKRQISKEPKKKSITSYSCDICYNRFTEKIIFQAHVQCHKDPPYICTECGKEFISRVYFRSHVRRVHSKNKGRISISDTSYKCDICNKQFIEKIIWQAHVQCHNDPPYSCTACGKEFIGRAYFKTHTIIHSERKFKCTLCPRQFYRKDSLKNHFTKTHETECSKCNKVFKSNEEFQLHRTKEHFKELYFKCEICDKVLTRIQNYEDHMRTHESGTPFQCKQCPEAFQNKYRLKQHKALEHNIGKLRCNNCYKYFADKSVFDAHVKAHEAESPHVCPQCGKTFNREQEFRVHVKKHDEENCYKCKQCGKFYLKFSAYKDHMATHS